MLIQKLKENWLFYSILLLSIVFSISLAFAPFKQSIFTIIAMISSFLIFLFTMLFVVFEFIIKE